MGQFKKFNSNRIKPNQIHTQQLMTQYSLQKKNEIVYITSSDKKLYKIDCNNNYSIVDEQNLTNFPVQLVWSAMKLLVYAIDQGNSDIGYISIYHENLKFLTYLQVNAENTLSYVYFDGSIFPFPLTIHQTWKQMEFIWSEATGKQYRYGTSQAKKLFILNQCPSRFTQIQPEYKSDQIQGMTPDPNNASTQNIFLLKSKLKVITEKQNLKNLWE